jgi:hypothetical protein
MPSQEVIPPTPIESVMWGAVDVSQEMHDTLQQALLWTGLDDDERGIVIEGEMALASTRKRKFEHWIKIGEALKLLQEEVMRQSNATSNRGKRYNKFWNALAPTELKRMGRSDRARAIDLWEHHEPLLAWWDTVKPNQRDRWNHPLIILREFERAQRIGLNSPPHDEDDEDRPQRRPDRRAGQAAAIDDATAKLHDAADLIKERVTPDLNFDLSTPELIRDSAENFLALYGGDGKESIQQFTEALRDANTEWKPGADFWHDEPEEIAAYLLAGDEQKAVKVARAILDLYNKSRKRRSPKAKEE